mgnify:CR=1 FL=1
MSKDLLKHRRKVQINDLLVLRRLWSQDKHFNIWNEYVTFALEGVMNIYVDASQPWWNCYEGWIANESQTMLSNKKTENVLMKMSRVAVAPCAIGFGRPRSRMIIPRRSKTRNRISPGGRTRRRRGIRSRLHQSRIVVNILRRRRRRRMGIRMRLHQSRIVVNIHVSGVSDAITTEGRNLDARDKKYEMRHINSTFSII